MIKVWVQQGVAYNNLDAIWTPPVRCCQKRRIKDLFLIIYFDHKLRTHLLSRMHFYLSRPISRYHYHNISPSETNLVNKLLKLNRYDT